MSFNENCVVRVFFTLINGDITSAVHWQWQGAAWVISPFIIWPS